MGANKCCLAKFKRSLGLFDATALSIGSIVGAGIFVISGVASGIAGPSVILAVILAGIVSSFTAFSYAKLASRYTEEGGAYVFAKRTISRFAGFLTGWMWLFASVVAGATVSIGLASYVVSLFPGLPLVPIAMSAILLLMLLNIVGIRQSSIFNAVLVLLKLSALGLFVVIGFSHIDFALYQPFAPHGIKGILGATALIFFAYTGFGSPATAAEEIKDPRRTVPRSIMIALALSSVVYVMVAVVTVGVIPYQKLAGSGSPLTDAVVYGIRINWLKYFVSFAAIVATISVLLTTLLGLSRVSFAMSRDKLLPSFFKKMHSKYSTPYVAILVVGSVMAVLPLFGSLQQTANVTNFGALLGYGVANFGALLYVKKEHIRFSRHIFHLVIPALGLLSCTVLMYFLSVSAWVIGLVWICAGIAYYALLERSRKKPPQGRA